MVTVVNVVAQFLAVAVTIPWDGVLDYIRVKKKYWHAFVKSLLSTLDFACYVTNGFKFLLP